MQQDGESERRKADPGRGGVCSGCTHLRKQRVRFDRPAGGNLQTRLQSLRPVAVWRERPVQTGHLLLDQRTARIWRCLRAPKWLAN